MGEGLPDKDETAKADAAAGEDRGGGVAFERSAGRRGEDSVLATLQEAMSEISQGILVIDPEMKIVFVNDTYRGYFGFPPDAPEVREGVLLEEMLWILAERGEYGPGRPGNHVEARLRPVRERTGFEMDRQLKKGKWVHITGTPLGNGGYAYTFTDITERVEEKKRLDRLVHERTEELHEVNSKLLDGIEYARLIQTGILPQKAFLKENLGPHFLLFRPADIVGGDFYIGVKTDYGLYLGLGDCTGHGVPGAMMTMMAASVARRAINETGVGGPAAVMMAIDRIVRTNLHQSDAQVGPDNGLELTLCLIERDLGRVRVAGAGLDIFVQSDGVLDRVRGTKHGLGYGRQSRSATEVRETLFARGEIDRIFLTSDGILDQSGGEKGFGFGRRRMVDALQAAAAEAIDDQGHALVMALEAFSDGYVQRDDLAVLGFCPFET